MGKPSPEKIARDQEIQDMKDVLALDGGKRFVWRILEHCGLYRNPYSGERNSTDHNCGMQSVGQWLMDECLSANKAATADLIINRKLIEDDHE